jgi:D-sedoheptulose 7-phosphate isomerase
MKLEDVQNALSEINPNDISKLSELVNNASQVILIGNGGSNAIASHIAVDYVKFLNKKSLAFSDPSMLTAFMNDCGTEYAYKEYIRNMHQDGGLVILISSSGNSLNIYFAAEYCKCNNIDFVILTGFKEDNSVRATFGNHAKLEYWVNSNSYGTVECVHQIFLHMIVDN